MLFDLFGPLLGPLLIMIMVIVVFESCWRKCPPDKLMIVSGFGQTRSVSGKGTFVIPGLQRVDTLALGAVQVQLSTENEIPTQDAILIHACAVANFQIGQTPELIEIASKNYLNMDKAEMTRQVTEVMLGKMREVIGQIKYSGLHRACVSCPFRWIRSRHIRSSFGDCAFRAGQSWTVRYRRDGRNAGHDARGG